MRGVVYGLAALVLMAAGTESALGLGGFGREAARVAGPVLGEDGAYSAVVQQVAAIPAGDPLPTEAAAGMEAALTALVAESGVPCQRVDHVLRGRDEHPAYTLVTALCDCTDGHGRLVNVMLFQSGRAAALDLGVVMVETAVADGNIRYYAF